MIQTYRTSTLPFDKLTPLEQTVEIFYKRIVELTKAAYMAINRAYPLHDRKENPKVEYRYAEAHRQAKQHQNFYKKAVAEFTQAYCKVKRHPSVYDATDDRPTQDFRKYIENQFDLLYGKLIEYADLLVPEEDVPSYLKSLEKVYTSERRLLTDGGPPVGITHYEITPVLKATDFTERFGRLVAVDRTSKRSIKEMVEEQR